MSPSSLETLKTKQAMHVLVHVDDVINISANSIMVRYAIPVIYGWRKCTKKCKKYTSLGTRKEDSEQVNMNVKKNKYFLLADV